MAYHQTQCYKRLAKEKAQTRTQVALTSDELNEVNTILDRFVTRFKEKHL